MLHFLLNRIVSMYLRYLFLFQEKEMEKNALKTDLFEYFFSEI
jgi:hypothetical protein